MVRGNALDFLPREVRLKLQTKIACPHCWETFGAEESLWITQHSDLLGDARLGVDHQQRFLPSRFDVKGNAIDSRGFSCTRLACPKCHLEVPRALFETPAMFLSILGSPACGKSYFLASMTWQLRSVLPKRFSLSFSDIDPASNRPVNANEELIFLNSDPNKLVAIRKTELQGELYDTVLFGDQTVSFPRPFSFGVRPQRNHPNAEIASRVGRILCLYDNAGEHFLPGQDTVGSPVTRHLSRSEVVLFLFDPTQDPRFRNACRDKGKDPQLADAARTMRQETVLHEAADRVRRYCSLAHDEKHEQPLIVVVTKYDAWEPLLGLTQLPNPYVFKEQDDFQGLNVPAVDEISGKLRSLLWKYTPEIVSTAESFAKQVLYIPVSATGSSPEIDSETGMLGLRSSAIKPMWVEIPMLYALAKGTKGMIPVWTAGEGS